MFIDKFLEKTPDLHKEFIPHLELIEKLQKSALTHTSREYIHELFEQQKPNETDDQLQYRLDNYRRLTIELFDQVMSKTSRSIMSDGFRITNASKILQTELDNNSPYVINNTTVSWKKYFTNCILPESFINATRTHWLLPINPDDETLTPNKHNKQNAPFTFKPIIVESNMMRVVTRGLFVYQTEYVAPVSKTRSEPVLMAIDSNNWYRLIPYLKKKNGDAQSKVYYTPEIWYRHEFGFVPYNWLVGRAKKTDDKHDYIDSFLSTAFEHLNEAVNAISDDQAVRNNSAYPHIIMGQLDCEACSGNGEIRSQTCKKCKGSGIKPKSGHLDAYVVPNATMHGNESHLNPFIQFVSPDVGILEHMHQIAFGTFYQNSFRVIGLKPFTDVQESGEAKKQRQNDLQDFLREVTIGSKIFCERMLLYHELYLKNGRAIADVEKPEIRIPKTFLAIDADVLSERLVNENGFAKRETQTQLYFLKYGETPRTEKIMHFAHLYAPLLSDNRETVQFKINTGVYGGQDVVRADYAISVFEELSHETSFLTWDFPTAKVNADKLLAEWGLIVQEIRI